MNEHFKYFCFKGLLQNNTWMMPAYVGVNNQGIIKYLSAEKPASAQAIEEVNGYALPGFCNAHSHAFQYAMAGRAEIHHAGSRDDFWTWREAMYQCALSVDPDQAEAIATMLYAELLRLGYTHVAEFHYLHHDKNGKRYNNLAEMGECMVAAAKKAGIKITLIPVFYQQGGFNKAPEERQRRFISHTVDDYLMLLDQSARVVKENEHAALGFSVHSLRAVNSKDIITVLRNGPGNIPFHMHIAEQLKEVDDCKAYLKKRPVEWLLENLPVDSRFNLVHATHITEQETIGLASSGANVVLCPSTEGNLGDGFFNMITYAQHNGRWCIGTDSHIGIDPLEEFRMIDYRQRLLTNTRNPFSNNASLYMLTAAFKNGENALGSHRKKFFELDQPLDAVVYDADTPLLSLADNEKLLSILLYAGNGNLLKGTIVNGSWIVKSHHVKFREIATRFADVVRTIYK